MPTLRLLILPALLLSVTACKERKYPSPKSRDPLSRVVLDGTPTEVRWSDGDTFAIQSGPNAGSQARLHGYNTLEDYGPVHRWGTWTAKELFANAKAAGAFARSREWTCQSRGAKDGYGRLLVACPDAAQALLREGLAFVFAMDAAADPELLESQHQAQQARAGMWAKGVPAGIVSSVHSADEGKGYSRVVDTASGAANGRKHQERYSTCQEVCVGEGQDESCLLYVPFERRYRNRPACLE